MQSTYDFIKNIIIIEIILVILIVLLAYGMKYYYSSQAKKKQDIKKQITAFIENMLANHSKFNEKHFLKTWHQLDILLPVIHVTDQAHADNPEWHPLKSQLIQTILLPLAREKALSKKWVNRLLAAECFQMKMEPKDESTVLSLVKDSRPIIHLYATLAAIQFGSQNTIHHVIAAMSDKRRLAQTMYLQAFESSVPEMREHVAACLKDERNPYVRTTCYKILLKYPPLNDFVIPDEDIYSKNVELSLAATRLLACYKEGKAGDILIKQLSSESWQVRSVSAGLLGKLKVKKAVNELARYLRDPIWQVRMNAASALKEIGPAGIEILETQQPEIDQYAYDAAMHVLHRKVVLSQE